MPTATGKSLNYSPREGLARAMFSFPLPAGPSPHDTLVLQKTERLQGDQGSTGIPHNIVATRPSPG
jgi:hypothetical protein